MTQKVDVPVSVVFSFNSQTRHLAPTVVSWGSRDYAITKVGLHHTYREGRTLFHVFSVASTTIFFRLVLNTDNLFWRLTEVSDDFAL
jgi:hypothetical protein